MHPCGNGKIYFLDVCTPAATEKIHFLDVCTPATTEKIHFLDVCTPAATEKIHFLDVCTLATTEKYIFSMDASLQQRKEIFSMLQTEGRTHLFLIEIVHSGSKNHRLSPCFLLILQPR